MISSNNMMFVFHIVRLLSLHSVTAWQVLVVKGLWEQVMVKSSDKDETEETSFITYLIHFC